MNAARAVARIKFVFPGAEVVAFCPCPFHPPKEPAVRRLGRATRESSDEADRQLQPHGGKQTVR